MPFDTFALLRLNYGPKVGVAFGEPEDPMLKEGKWRMYYYRHKEWDPLYIDPAIANSRVTMIDGQDTLRTPSQEWQFKYMGMPSDVWRYNVLYRQNPTIKNIYDKWDISAEHPGMQFRTKLRGDFDYLKVHGYMWNTRNYFKTIGGSYYNAPDGEECFVKTWSPVRATLVLGAVLWLWDLGAVEIPYGAMNKFVHYCKYVGPATGAAAMWGSTTCLSCSIRGRDDLINYIFGGVSYGLVIGMRYGWFRGCQTGVLAAVGGCLFRLYQDYEEGPSMYSPKWTPNIIDPASHKWLAIDTHYRDLPKERKW